jgi:xanthine dehydrogenase YagS FAD-binding subunit
VNNFSWVEPKNIQEAAAAVKGGGAALAGGIELLCLLKDELLRPEKVVNLKTVRTLARIEGGRPFRIGALAKLSQVASHKEVLTQYRALAEAAESVASPQIRNVGTVGGNLCQRPRCWYFRDPEVHCLKKGGATCYAVNGSNEYHAVLGGGPCHIVHPSDLAPALIAHQAVVVTTARRIPAEEFFVLPSENLMAENKLDNGELVTGVELGPSGWRSAYYKARERMSFDWALASCAVALKLDGSKVTDARVILGGVAPKPWRSTEAEAVLKGKPVDETIAREAGSAAFAKAKPMADNGYKLTLGANVVAIAALKAASG